MVGSQRLFYQASYLTVVCILGSPGDQPLLDVRFPDVSRHGQGVHLNSYSDTSTCWRKLTLWHVLNAEGMQLKKEVPKIRTLNVASKNYEQTYCILKSSWDNSSPMLSVHHDVLFRFGSWCYSGRYHSFRDLIPSRIIVIDDYIFVSFDNILFLRQKVNY